jgi:hypothetical protein
MVAPRAPTHEHLPELSVEDSTVIADRLRAIGARTATPNNPFRAAHGTTFEDPVGYHVVIARRA